MLLSRGWGKIVIVIGLVFIVGSFAGSQNFGLYISIAMGIIMIGIMFITYAFMLYKLLDINNNIKKIIEMNLNE